LFKSLNIYEKLGNQFGVIMTTFNLANIFMLQDDYQKADSSYKKVYNFCVKNNIAEGIVRSLIGLAENETSNGLDEHAKVYYLEALEISQKEDLLQFQQDILFNISQLIIKTYSKDTVNYLAQFEIIQDSIYKQNTTNKILELEKKHSSSKKDAEILLLNKNSKLAKNRLVIMALAVVLLIVIVILISLYFRKRHIILMQKHLLLQEKDKTRELVLVQTDLVAREQITKAENAQLETKLKEQEIVFHTISYAKLISVFHEVMEKLDTFTYKLRGKHDREDFKKVLQYMDKNNNINPLDEFEKVFKKVYPGFNSALIKKYPTLSPREIQLCALLKLNMQTKDIALITNISARTVETSRYRIRKKMDLTTNQNLISELLSI